MIKIHKRAEDGQLIAVGPDTESFSSLDYQLIYMGYERITEWSSNRRGSVSAHVKVDDGSL